MYIRTSASFYKKVLKERLIFQGNAEGFFFESIQTFAGRKITSLSKEHI
jgi:hypothetical protein